MKFDRWLLEQAHYLFTGKNTDRWFMERAVEQARKCQSEEESVPPKVGAVLAINGRLVGESYRGERNEGDHAEYILLHKKFPNLDVSEATLYTTLEPCVARGKDKKPCTDWIKEKGIKRVFIGTLDHDARICGIGHLTLMESDVSLQYFDHDLAKELIELNAAFIAKRGGLTELRATRDKLKELEDLRTAAHAATAVPLEVKDVVEKINTIAPESVVEWDYVRDQIEE